MLYYILHIWIRPISDIRCETLLIAVFYLTFQCFKYIFNVLYFEPVQLSRKLLSTTNKAPLPLQFRHHMMLVQFCIAPNQVSAAFAGWKRVEHVVNILAFYSTPQISESIVAKAL